MKYQQHTQKEQTNTRG